MANECIPFYEPAARITAKASAVVTGKRLVKVTGDRSTDGNVTAGPATAADTVILGVADRDAPADGLFGVIKSPGIVVPVEAAGAISAGEAVQVGSAGRVAAFSTGTRVGVAVASASDGEDCAVALFLG